MCTERKATGEYVLACFMFATMPAIMQSDRMVLCLIQLSERWHCHIWLVGRMKLDSRESIQCFFSLSLSLGGVPTSND